MKFTLIPSGNNYSSNLTFDRTKFEITYRSGNFFENLGDRLINDDVELEVSLVHNYFEFSGGTLPEKFNSK